MQQNSTKASIDSSRMERRFPSIPQVLLALAILGIPVLLGAYVLEESAKRVSTPHSMKLADCTNDVVRFKLSTPPGHGFYLYLKTPDIESTPNGVVASQYKFSGRLSISSNSTLLAAMPVGSDKAWVNGTSFGLTGV